jgi:hypothetical protein
MEAQQSMEVLQVLRSNPLQLSQLETPADKETALRFIDSLQAVLERRKLHDQDET